MPYKIPQSKVKQRMVKEAAAKHGQLLQLQQEHSRLKSQHDVLMQCCDLLQWLRLQQMPEDDIDMLDGDYSISSFNGIDQYELQLLQQLHPLPQSALAANNNNTTGEHPTAAPTLQFSSSSINSSASSSSWHPNAACAQPDTPALSAASAAEGPAPAGQPCSTLSPGDDTMQFFRNLISQPPPPRGKTISLTDLQDEYAATVCELSLNLAALETSDAHAGLQEHPVDAINRLVLRHFHMLVSMVLHRHELLMAFYVTNCISREYRTTGVQEAMDKALSSVQLSPQQQQHISDIIAVFKRLIAPLIQARQQLQFVGICSTAAVSSRTKATVTAADGKPTAVAEPTSAAVQVPADEEECSSEGSSSDVFLDVEVLNQRPSLQQQQQKVSDLRTLMKKEFLLKAVSVCSTLGCLTALQVARLMVSMFPFPAPMNMLGQEIARRWDAQQEQQLAAALAATAVSGTGRQRAGKRQQRG